MSKKCFSTAGMDILGLRQMENGKAEGTLEPAAAPGRDTPANLPAITPAEKLVRKSYYVTPSQHKALKIKAANGETEKDISAIIRNAIDLYLAQNREAIP